MLVGTIYLKIRLKEKLSIDHKKRRPLKRSRSHGSTSQPMEGSTHRHALGLTRLILKYKFIELPCQTLSMGNQKMSQHDSGQEIIEDIQAIKQDKGRCVKVTTPADVKITREEMHLSQSAFAALLGVSVRTLQDWEQGRRKPSSAAKSLLLIAKKYPHLIKKIFR